MIRKAIYTTLLLLVSLFAFAQGNETQEQYNARVRETLAIDYSMPDYSIKRIDAKVMGPRLAAILTKLGEEYKQHSYLNTLRIVQGEQIDGLNYVRIKNIKLDRVTKFGNEIVILYKTSLGTNNLKMRSAVLRLEIKDGASGNVLINDLLCNICRYAME